MAVRPSIFFADEFFELITDTWADDFARTPQAVALDFTMARNRDPFTQALSSLRDRIQSGDLAGGTPVIVQDEARRLSLSTTPIREALRASAARGWSSAQPREAMSPCDWMRRRRGIGTP